jgi:3-methyladenine DNA glycosylase Tag
MSRAPQTTPFATILKTAEKRSGGQAKLADYFPRIKTAKALKGVSDDRYLSLMCRRIFRAGLNHTVVDQKWPAFEEVFHTFEPRRVRGMSDEALEALMKDARVIRHWGKIKAVRENAAAMCRISEQHGAFGAYIADWPGARITELWMALGKDFSQMGGRSGAWFLRMAGKDTFMMTGAVQRALVHWGAMKSGAKGKALITGAQTAFNGWADETGRPLSEISMILARSVD